MTKKPDPLLLSVLDRAFQPFFKGGTLDGNSYTAHHTSLRELHIHASTGDGRSRDFIIKVSEMQ